MHLHQAGVTPPAISEWFGHSNIETTRFYAKVTEEMRREALHKLSDSGISIKYRHNLLAFSVLTDDFIFIHFGIGIQQASASWCWLASEDKRVSQESAQ